VSTLYRPINSWSQRAIKTQFTSQSCCSCRWILPPICGSFCGGPRVNSLVPPFSHAVGRKSGQQRVYPSWTGVGRVVWICEDCLSSFCSKCVPFVSCGIHPRWRCNFLLNLNDTGQIKSNPNWKEETTLLLGSWPSKIAIVIIVPLTQITRHAVVWHNEFTIS
jgi:hypothetical protein